ncbi:uncharacterized protein LOC132738929 isoform X1 [Ruditapes philippinarum]|uniref:uncharacterized protein LOC132738929 isoform X1 n=1 Tax=Ruditapes philippinarum TaxID=129788 RepID=UPI00295B399F|nr:uncharacterized protein LOC132738929 isoform X1 [Ruditapes philippinarum]
MSISGFIPGHCTSMDVEVGKHYVLFLKGKQEGDDFYEQSPGQTAAPKSKLMDYLNVCDLFMEYPQEHGMMINRPVCPPASKLDTCKRRGDTKHPEVVTVKSKQHDMQGTSYFVSCFFLLFFERQIAHARRNETIR